MLHNKIVILLSGGLDSTCLLQYLKTRNSKASFFALGFEYGQKNKKELLFAQDIALHYGIDYKVVDLSSINILLSNSALTNLSMEIPDSAFGAESMKLTVVPNRNAIFLSIATGYAVSIGASEVVIAIHAGDHAIYPDCRREFLDAFARMALLATDGFNDPEFSIDAPFLSMTKGKLLSFTAKTTGYLPPFTLTWSCYRGGEFHCGKCGACVERKLAFSDAGINDPTVYEA